MGMDRSRGLCSLRVKSVPALNLFNFALLKSILFASIPSLSWIRPLELAGDNDLWSCFDRFCVEKLHASKYVIRPEIGAACCLVSWAGYVLVVVNAICVIISFVECELIVMRTALGFMDIMLNLLRFFWKWAIWLTVHSVWYSLGCDRIMSQRRWDRVVLFLLASIECVRKNVMWYALVYYWFLGQVFIEDVQTCLSRSDSSFRYSLCLFF